MADDNYGFDSAAVTVLKERYMHINPDTGQQETIPEMFQRVAGYVANVKGRTPDEVERRKKLYYEVMMRRDFMPNSPTLMNAGREGKSAQLSACYVLPIEDSMDGIYTALKNQALIHKYGGGTGFNFSPLRPKGSRVNTTNGLASGPVSFMELFDVSTEKVMQGGCFKAGTLVATKGGAVPIEKIKAGTLVYSHDLKKGFVLRPCTGAFMTRKEQSIWELVTDTGFSVFATRDHPFIIRPNDNKKGYQYAKLGDLTPETELFSLNFHRNGRPDVKQKQKVATVFNTELKDDVWNVEVPDTHNFVVCDADMRAGLVVKNTRRGANMGILNVDHPDILEFIACKAEDKNRLNNFNISVGMNDEFMQKVSDHTLNEYEQKIWDAIIDCAWKNGDPGLVFFDEINRRNTIPEFGELTATNPCLRGNMKILTDKGYIPIAELVGQKVNIWNGFEWSEVEPKVTGHNQKMLRVTFSNGSVIDCTPYHKFMLNDGRRVEAKNLKINDTLAEYTLPVIPCVNIDPQELDYMWCAGFYVGDGSKRQMNSGKTTIYLYGEKKKLLNYFKPYLKTYSYSACKDMIRMYMKHEYCWDKNFVPTNGYSIKERLAWLAGFIDADGARNSKEGALNITNTDLELLTRTRELLNTLGVNATVALTHEEGYKYMPDGKGGKKLYHRKKCYRLSISPWNNRKLQELGLTTRRVNITCDPARNAGRKIRVMSINPCEDAETVYCLTEPKRHSFITEGVSTRNCGETPLLPFEACNLGSINLSNFVSKNYDIDFERLDETTCIAVDFLNDVIDVNQYPIPEVTEAVHLTRKIGLGVMGWADVLYKLGIRYGSDESLKLADFIMGFINSVGHEQSAGRNATVTCIAPTGSISLIAGCSSGIEPHFALEYDRIAFDKENRTILHFVNPEYQKSLETNDGRVERGVFVTAHDISFFDHIKMQAAFQKNTDLAVSKTINMRNEATRDDVERAYIFAWLSGCKGITVYRDGSRDKQVLYTSELEVCPECGNKSVVHESGCKQCSICGWSACSI